MHLFHQKGSIKTGSIGTKQEIFQGDSLSPLLFLLNRQGIGYAIDDKNTVTHLLYIDDLKIFCRDEKQLRQAMHIVKTFSDDIQMVFGQDKCTTVFFMRGVRVKSHNIQLSGGSSIKNLDLDKVYKYLGIDIQHNEMKSKIAKEYYRRVRLVLRSKLNAKNKISAINSLAVPVPTYSFGMVDWRVEEIRKMDRKMRKLLTSIYLCTTRKQMLTDYTSRDATVDIAIVSLSKYIERGTDKLIKMMKHEVSKTKYSLMKMANEIRKHYGLPRQEDHPESAKTVGGKPSGSSLDEGRVLRENIERDRIKCVKEKALHGKFFKYRNEPFVDKEPSLAWLRSSGLKGETESLIIAAQDQAFNTRYHQRKILNLQVDGRCRMCGVTEETVSHIISGCSTLAGTDYKERHNKVASYIHWTVCKEFGVEVPNKGYENVPQPVVNTDECTIMWDKGVFTDLTISANRPDIIVHNKKDKMCLPIDVAIQVDHNVVEKENDKLIKYKSLGSDISRSWNTRTQIVPVVIGALGCIKKGFHRYLDQIPGKPSAFEAQKIVLCGTAHILRKVLS